MVSVDVTGTSVGPVRERCCFIIYRIVWPTYLHGGPDWDIKHDSMSAEASGICVGTSNVTSVEMLNFTIYGSQ